MKIIFSVQEKVFSLGDIKDPISGEMVVGTQYRYSFFKRFGDKVYVPVRYSIHETFGVAIISCLVVKKPT